MDEVARDWRKLLTKDTAGNKRMMELMHEATIAQIDPAEDFVPVAEKGDPQLVERYGLQCRTGAVAQVRIDEEARRFVQWQMLRAKFLKLPVPFRTMYRTVRNDYTTMADAFDQAILANAE